MRSLLLTLLLLKLEGSTDQSWMDWNVKKSNGMAGVRNKVRTKVGLFGTGLMVLWWYLR